MAKSVFANLPIGWTKLNDGDTIFNCHPLTWIEEENLHEYVFVNVGYDGKNHKLHISQIQIVSNL